MPPMSANFPKRRRLFLAPAFASIAVVFLLANLAAMVRARDIQSRTHLIVENMLTSVALVTHMQRDVDHERLLVDAHIFEKTAVDLRRIEGQIDATEASFDADARAYDPLATLPGERAAWQKAQGDVLSARAPIAEVLALSRQGRDDEARRAMAALDGRFEEISVDVAELVRINRTEADEQVRCIAALQRSWMIFFTALMALGIVATLMVAWRAIRLVRLRETQAGQYAAALEERNRDLDAFAGRVAHDLRGPLTTISLAAAALALKAHGEDSTSSILRRGVTRMEKLIEDLLALSRIDAQRVGACDPSLSVAEIREELGPRLEREGGTLRAEVAPAKVRCGDGLLRQVLWNLVDNGLKYRRPDVPPEIEIRGRAHGRQYELLVSDNGAGMSPDEAHKAFEPFYRAPRVHELPGTGLGLSIVKRVIEASGGRVSVDSQLGSGTTFAIRLSLDGQGE